MSGEAVKPAPEDVRLTEDGKRFELDVAGQTAFIDVRPARSGGVAMLHTEVPTSLEGRGVGSALVRGSLDMLRARGDLVLPFCPFVHTYIKRHREYVDLVDPTYPRVSDLAG